MAQLDRQDADDEPKKTAREVLGEVGNAVHTGFAPVAGRVGEAVRSGVARFEQALDDPAKSLSNEMLEQVDLPEIAGDDPLGSLGIRLDGEADFWRGVAMRQMTRAAWVDRLSISSTVVFLVGIVILASIAAFRALMASDAAEQVSILIGVAALLLFIGAVTIQRAAAKIRQGQLNVARDALARSDLAESRLHRLAALTEMRTSDQEGYRTALRELESDMRGT